MLMGLGDGSFAAERRFGVGRSPESVAIGDFDGDGMQDLAVANERTDDVSVLLGLGDGSFAEEQRFATGDGSTSVAAGDFDGDGLFDLVTGSPARIFFGEGDGRFDDAPLSISTGQPLVTDVEGDSVDELLVTTREGILIRVAEDRSATTETVFGPTVFDRRLGTVLADIDGDGSVSVTDLTEMIVAWGSDDPDIDLNGNGIVEVGDLIMLIAAWGPC